LNKNPFNNFKDKKRMMEMEMEMEKKEKKEKNRMMMNEIKKNKSENFFLFYP